MSCKDIKLLKSIVKVHNTFLKGCKKETITAREIQAIENLLKENEELRNNSVPVAKIKEIVDKCVPRGKNIITDEEEYQPNTNANMFLTQEMLKLLEVK